MTKYNPITETIKVSPELGKWLEAHRVTYSIVFKNVTEAVKPHNQELAKILVKHSSFSSLAQIVAYLLSSHNWEIVEPRYQMQLLDDNDLFVNYEPSTGQVSLDTASEMLDICGNKYFQTIFTQAEIDANPVLKKFEPFKKEYHEPKQ